MCTAHKTMCVYCIWVYVIHGKMQYYSSVFVYEDEDSDLLQVTQVADART